MSIQTALLILNFIAIVFGGGYSYGSLNASLKAIEMKVDTINGDVRDLGKRVRSLEIEGGTPAAYDTELFNLLIHEDSP